MTYEDVLLHLDALQMHKIKLGLEAMQSFLAKVDRPETRLKFVHIAGTNGKGSVCATLSEVLGRAGYRIGVYTSPHLSSVRERFRIGSDYISEKTFAELGSRICRVLGEEQITYFEFTTALGLLWFAESDVDLVLLETGLGGRLDATNVVTPLVSVITSVSMDHETYLGGSLTEIAGEKAGIIKSGVPVISSAVREEAATVIQKVSAEKKAPLYCLGQDFDYVVHADNTWEWRGGEAFGNKVYSNLRSSHASLVQQENDSLSLAVLQVLYDKLVGVWGSMSDKDMGATLGVIAPLMDALIITQPDGERSATPEQLYGFLDDDQKPKVRCITEVAKALESAQQAAEEEDFIVVGGSLYLIGAVRHLLLGALV